MEKFDADMDKAKELYVDLLAEIMQTCGALRSPKRRFYFAKPEEQAEWQEALRRRAMRRTMQSEVATLKRGIHVEGVGELRGR